LAHRIPHPSSLPFFDAYTAAVLLICFVLSFLSLPPPPPRVFFFLFPPILLSSGFFTLFGIIYDLSCCLVSTNLFTNPLGLRYLFPLHFSLLIVFRVFSSRRKLHFLMLFEFFLSLTFCSFHTIFELLCPSRFLNFSVLSADFGFPPEPPFFLLFFFGGSFLFFPFLSICSLFYSAFSFHRA